MTEVHGALDAAAFGQLRASVGDDPDFLAELVAEFLDDAPSQLEALREALVSGDAGGARRAAHTLKGNGRTFGARGLASLCQEARPRPAPATSRQSSLSRPGSRASGVACARS